MNWGPPESIHRTAKALLDAGRASSPEEARRILERLVLQVAVGADVQHDLAAQAALATVVNAARRAHLGGVRVRLDVDPPMTAGWATGTTAAETVTRYGGQVVDQLSSEWPTLVIGSPQAVATGHPVLHLTWQGWSGGVVQASEHRLSGEGTTLAGVAAAAMGISEAFQRALGAVLPGRRNVGISLWRPDLDWRTAEAAGPTMQYLPASLWLLGLGHLGQAYAWTLGMLPYRTPNDVNLGLVDFDFVIEENAATQMLVTSDSFDRRKARVVADALETRGFTTRIVERAYDQHFRPFIHGDPARNEPTIALAGFDDIAPRRQLGQAGFSRVVDAGLGTGAVEYLDMVIHAFPGPEDPATAFVEAPTRPRALPAPYEAEVARRAQAGGDETAARCGLLDIAGVTVGAAFVGTLTSTLVVSDILRLLHDGMNYSVIAVDLRNPASVRAVPNSAPGSYPAPAYTEADL